MEEMKVERGPTREALKTLYESRSRIVEGSGAGAYECGMSCTDIHQILEDGKCGVNSHGGFSKWEIEDSFNQCCGKYSLVLEYHEFLKFLHVLAQKKNIPLTALHHHLVSGCDDASNNSVSTGTRARSKSKSHGSWVEDLEKLCCQRDKEAEHVNLPPALLPEAPLEEPANDNAEQALIEFREFVNNAWQEPSRAFDAFDPGREGHVLISNLHALLRRRGYTRSSQELRVIFKGCQLTDDKIKREDFVNLWELCEMEAVDDDTRKCLNDLQIQRLLCQSMTPHEQLLAAVYAPALRLCDAYGLHSAAQDSSAATDQSALVDALMNLDAELRKQAPAVELATLLISSEGLQILTSTVGVGNAEVGRLALSLLSKAVAAVYAGIKCSTRDSSKPRQLQKLESKENEPVAQSPSVNTEVDWHFRAQMRVNYSPEDLLGDVRADGTKVKPKRVQLKPVSVESAGSPQSPRPDTSYDRSPRLSLPSNVHTSVPQQGSLRSAGGEVSVAGDLERRLCVELWRPLFSFLDPDDDSPGLPESLLPSLWALLGRIQLAIGLIGPNAVPVSRVAAHLRHLRPGAGAAEEALQQAVSGIRGLEDRIGDQVQILAVALGGCALLRSSLQMISSSAVILTEANQLLREWSREKQRLLLKWPAPRRQLDELRKYNAAAKFKAEACEKPRYPASSGLVRRLAPRQPPPRVPPVITDEDREQQKLQPIFALSGTDKLDPVAHKQVNQILTGALTAAPMKLEDVQNNETRRRISMSKEAPDESEVEAQRRAVQRVQNHFRRLNSDLGQPPPPTTKPKSTSNKKLKKRSISKRLSVESFS
eukprot:gnl/MRDRNA2_/MRDRNA2_70062_c0_seq1.p1 gnl/MRDRNA2_/MRDRNA2_70062_c0~~gnl/MRDRNA2_/MRDRNA2_70062_c0_seq1.p1  ORF type:complete len:958 (+),score=188.18 gnl/MRDRNA2_/MRDRNA2_70062_c0_seq1:409-2874(+)